MTTGGGQAPVRFYRNARVALAMMGMNIAVYAFTVIAARNLLASEFGAITALLGILLMGSVASLGLQAATARRIAVEPERAADIIAVTTRVTLIVALTVGSTVALSSVVLTPALKLESYWSVILCGATLIPLTVMGAQCGIAQGRARWNALTAIYLGNGIGRLVFGSLAMLIHPSVDAAMIGIAIGAWLPVIAGAHLLKLTGTISSRRGIITESILGSHALLAFFVLSNVDVLIARNHLDVTESGLYASGIILSKAALFLPQFVSVVVFPDLARATTNNARLRAASVVAGLGSIAVLATAILPQLAIIVVGGQKYADIASRLWLFALAGSVLAVVHLLVFDALARHAHGIAFLLWLAVVAVGGIAYGLDVHITGLVVTMVSVSTALAAIVWIAPAETKAVG